MLNDVGWPPGAVQLINDPTRTEGWQPFFSGWPSDVCHYLFKVSSPDDVNRLIGKLAAIQTNVQIRLSPNREASALGFMTGMKPGNGRAAVFSLGNQQVLDEWRQAPKAQPSGPKPPAQRTTAFAPTLTLFVGDPNIDLKKLSIPRHVNVSAHVSDSEKVRKEKPKDVTLKAIEAFLAKRRISLRRASQNTKPVGR